MLAKNRRRPDPGREGAKAYMVTGELKNIGRYQIKNRIGQGAMGEVYLALDGLIHRRVAIKRLRLDRFQNRTERRKATEYFLHEARIVGNLNHSHITAVYDLGILDGAPYLVMEFVDGSNIKELLARKEDFPLQEKLNLIIMVARALHYAHKRGILHRDIKPANIMILHSSRLPKITDFGIARVMDAASFGNPEKTLDEEGIIPGTPLYMSPEQIRGEELDQRSDLFSLAVLSYEWICGSKPFQGQNLNARLQAVLEQQPAALSKMSPGVDEKLSEIIMQALAKKPDDRLRNAEEFADTLELYLNSFQAPQAGEVKNFPFNKKKIIERLRQKYVFFADFTDEELFDIIKLSGKEVFEQGDYLIREGTSGTRMFIIISGSVMIITETEGKRIELDTIGEGSCVGEMSMVDRMPRSASVVAVKQTTALALNETVLRHSNPKLCLKLYRNLAAVLSERLRSHDARYLDLVATVQKHREEL
jgi:serine/threonine-protein kinase